VGYYIFEFLRSQCVISHQNIISSLFHLSEEVLIITCDGRCITGILAGFDQLQNLIIKNACERVYHLPPPDDDSLLEIVPLGLYLIRGDNVAIVSNVREGAFEAQEVEKGSDEFKVFEKGEAIKPVAQVWH